MTGDTGMLARRVGSLSGASLTIDGFFRSRRLRVFCLFAEKMRLSLKDKFWVVLDPLPSSTIGDILFEADLEYLRLQFLGGLTPGRNPTLFSDKADAEEEALARLKARIVYSCSTCGVRGEDEPYNLRLKFTRGDYHHQHVWTFCPPCGERMFRIIGEEL